MKHDVLEAGSAAILR